MRDEGKKEKLRNSTVCDYRSFPKVHSRTGHEGPEGGSSTLSSTSALDVVGGQSHGPVVLPTGKRTGNNCMGKISIQPGFEPRTFRDVTCSYTD